MVIVQLQLVLLIIFRLKYSKQWKGIDIRVCFIYKIVVNQFDSFDSINLIILILFN